MKQGDIVRADDRKKHIHPIIFIEEIDNESFIGCIISHEKKKQNVKMQSEHFEIQDENGDEYEIKYDDSYFVPQSFKKYRKWISQEKPVGKLTKEGIEFIQATRDKVPIHHDKHIRELDLTNNNHTIE